MVSQQTHPNPRTTQFLRLDASRILGLSSTLALNMLALSFLLMPMTLPAPPVVDVAGPALDVIDIVPIAPKTPPPPPVVKIVTPRPDPRPQPALRHAAEPAAEVAPVLADQGLEAVDTVIDATAVATEPPSLEPAGPATGLQLQYASAPAPAYPRAAIQRQLEGTVLLRVLVGTDGRPLEVEIERSSGHAVLDREALRHVQHNWRFRPALRDGRAVQAVGLVPIDFRLDRG